MSKLMTLVKANPTVPREVFANRWQHSFLPELDRLSAEFGGLLKAVHHHVLPGAVREGEGLVVASWSGVGCYYYDRQRDVEALLADPRFAALFTATSGLFHEVTHLVVDEKWIYNRDTSYLPLKLFAFFKRRPEFSRAAALDYYQTTHAAVGESINKNRTVRYIQNHVVDGYVNPDACYDYDGGPEIWFKSMEVALNLYNDKAAMDILGQDEARFVLRSELLNFMTDEVLVLNRQPAIA